MDPDQTPGHCRARLGTSVIIENIIGTPDMMRSPMFRPPSSPLVGGSGDNDSRTDSPPQDFGTCSASNNETAGYAQKTSCPHGNLNTSGLARGADHHVRYIEHDLGIPVRAAPVY